MAAQLTRFVISGAFVTALGKSMREKITVDQAKAELLSEKQPSHEFATPGQLGALAVFLCSDAAGWITGVNMNVDGGLNMNPGP